MKKILILVITLFMLFGVVACSSGEEDVETTETTEQVVEEQDEITEDDENKGEIEENYLYTDNEEKHSIEKAIVERINDGEYMSATLDRYAINGESEECIVLVYFNFEAMNKEETGNDMMKMYSDDIVATLANASFDNISEATIFWEDEYNNRSVKYAYEYDGNGFYISDIQGE